MAITYQIINDAVVRIRTVLAPGYQFEVLVFKPGFTGATLHFKHRHADKRLAVLVTQTGALLVNGCAFNGMHHRTLSVGVSNAGKHRSNNRIVES